MTIGSPLLGESVLTRATVTGGALAAALVVLALAFGHRVLEPDLDPAVAASPGIGPSAAESHQGLLYGRVTTDDGARYEGRLRFGEDEEAFWGHYFNGLKDGNPWTAHVRPDRACGARAYRDLRGRARRVGA
jgi:hypothetical protein